MSNEKKFKEFLSSLETGYYKKAWSIAKSSKLDKNKVRSAASKEYESALKHKKYAWALQLSDYFKLLTKNQTRSLAIKYYDNCMSTETGDYTAAQVAQKYELGRSRVKPAAESAFKYWMSCGMREDALDVAKSFRLGKAKINEAKSLG